MESKKIIILYGGFSPEREVSKKTGEGVFEALQKLPQYQPVLIDPQDFSSYLQLTDKIKNENPYIVFNALHGEEGENGKIQALFDLEDIPYTGSGHLASAIAMDKYLASLLVKALGLAVPFAKLITKKEQLKIDKYPVVIKPNDKGSSVGISIVQKEEELSFAIEKAFKVSTQVLMEEYIPGRELTVTILGDKALPVVEIIPHQGWYDFKNKYTKGNSDYIVPAKLSEQERIKIQSYALKIFNTIGCNVYGRVDFRYDGEDFYFLEVNTLPGMTPLSLTPKAAKSYGMSFEDLLIYIIENSKRRVL